MKPVSFWSATMPALPPAENRPLPAAADVVVIGGGYTGTTAAIHLARSGARVVLLEAKTLGWGASTRNGGMFHGGVRWRRETLQRRLGRDLGDRLHAAAREAFDVAERFIVDEALDCDYERTGQLVLAWGQRHVVGLEARAAEIAADGDVARVVRGADLEAEIGTHAYDVALVEERAGGLHPGRYLAALAHLAASSGVDLHAGTPAVGIERRPGRISVSTGRGVVVTERVLLATNGYTGGLLPWVRSRVIPIGSYILVTEPLSPALARAVLPTGRMCHDTKNFLYYWRLTPDGRVLFGGRGSFAPTSVTRAAASLERSMKEVHPQLRDVHVAWAWGGRVGFTFDRMPHVGTRDGVAYALGYSGSGVCMATYFGQLVARMLARGSEWPSERSPFEEIPFPAAPIPALYRGVPWFLPFAGEFFRIEDALARSRCL